MSNVNHLKELIDNLSLGHLQFFQLNLAFKSMKLHNLIILSIDDKGVVLSEKKLKSINQKRQ